MRPTMSRGSPKPPYFVQDGSGNEPLKGFGGGPGFDSWRESETTRPSRRQIGIPRARPRGDRPAPGGRRDCPGALPGSVYCKTLLLTDYLIRPHQQLTIVRPTTLAVSDWS
jgi:hypothetical protein